MIYQQLVTPNLDNTVQAGYCLLLQYLVWGSPRPYDFAEDAWNHAIQHPGEQPPNACVPVYWTFFDVQKNFEFGHIAAWIPGRGVFSSPFDSGYGNQWFPSIQAVTDRINQIKGANARYLGWSEDLAGLRIVQGENEDMATDNQIDEWISTQYQIAFNQPPSDAVFTDWRGVLKNNFVEGSISILKGIDTNAGALKNRPAPTADQYVPFTSPPLFTKK